MTRLIIHILFVSLFSVVLGNAYKVAVVEYYRGPFGNLEKYTKYSLSKYLSIIDDTVNKNKDLDLIVFPESTLVHSSSGYTKAELLKHSTNLPSSNTTIPCQEAEAKTSFYVKQLSCASIKHKIYISVDLKSKNSKGQIFNTNIVFDRQGRIVSKYNKMRLFGNEPYVTAGDTIEYFETDFGVTFGVFICFDILFEDTFREALDRKVDAFILPNFWYARTPQISSIESHRAWSYLHDTVLISSGGNNGNSASSGTGIYSGRTNAYVSYLSGEKDNKVFVAKISKDKPPKYDVKNHVRNLKNFHWIAIAPYMNLHSLQDKKPNTNIEKTVCDGEFCCQFYLNVNSLDGLVLSTYNGLYAVVGSYKLYMQMCVMLQCKDNDCYVMPEKHNAAKIFNQLEVKILQPTNEVEYYPNVALRDFQLLPVENYTFVDSELNVKLTQSSNDFYMFGFFGRKYNEDVLP